MDSLALRDRLSGLPLGEIRSFATIGSTNDYAAEWAAQGAPDLALVAADEQTAGRGRGQRKWFTPPGAALAFSLVLRPKNLAAVTRFSGLGALAVCQALQAFGGETARVKWPNDVLLNGRKTCGVLVETSWLGEQLSALILGIGINIAPSAVPPADWPGHHARPFPPTSVEGELGRPVERFEFLRAVLERLCDWYPRVGEDAFIHAWEKNLALRGEWVLIYSGNSDPLEAQVLSLNADGSLNVRLHSGEQVSLRDGEIHLRPVDSSSKYA